MSLDLTPSIYDWPTMKRGNTRPAFQVAMTGTASAITRIKCTVADADGVEKIALDSDATGITIESATAGDWRFTIGPITAAQTGALTSGTHYYDVEIVTDAPDERTWIEGTWEILPQITD